MNDVNIRHFKLINGDELLALVNSKNKDVVTLERPCVIYKNKLGSHSMMPWFPFAEKPIINLKIDRIIATSDLKDDVKLDYIRFATNYKDDDELETTTLLQKYEELLTVIKDKFDDDIGDGSEPLETTPTRTLH